MALVWEEERRQTETESYAVHLCNIFRFNFLHSCTIKGLNSVGATQSSRQHQ